MMIKGNFESNANTTNWRLIRRQLVILLPAYASSVMTGCMETWLPNAICFFRYGTEISATADQLTMMASMTEIGRILFAIPSGFLVDKYGRKNILAALFILSVVPWVAISSSESIPIIYFARFIMGVHYALSNASVLITIGEIASSEVRGKLVVMRNICSGFGALFQCVISIFFSSYWILAYSTCLLSLFGCLSSIWLIETPHHLIRTSKYEKARHNLIHCRPGYHEDDVNREFENLKKHIEAEKELKREINWLEFVKTKSIRDPLVTATLLVLFQTLIGTHVITTYVTEIIPTQTTSAEKFLPLFITLVALLPRFFTAFYIDRFARKKLCIIAGFVVCALQLSNAFTYYLYNTLNAIDRKLYIWIFTIGILLVKASASCILTPLTNLTKSEIFPHSVKGIGGSLCMLCGAFADFVALQLYAIVKICGLHYMYIFYALACVMFAFVAYLRLPRGKSENLADIHEKNDTELVV